jgi:hypothetical protein
MTRPHGAVVAAVVAVLLAVPAARADTQLSADRADSISAAGGWVSWNRSYYEDGPLYEWVLLHGGALSRVGNAYGRVLGTDAKGHPVAVDWPCSTCRAVERRLPDGSVRQLPRRVVRAAAESSGTLAYIRRGLGIYVLRAGARHVERVTRADALSLALGRCWLVYLAYSRVGYDIAAIDLRRTKGRARTLAINDTHDDDCRCTDTFVSEREPVVDGHFAYWVETVTSELEPTITTTVLRVDLAAKRPAVEAFSPQNAVSSIAVDRGTLYYTANEFGTGQGAYRVRAPHWRKTSRTLPVRG